MKWVRSVLLAGAMAIGGLGVFSGCAANPRVTRDSYERIREGMAMEEVEQILGKPSYKHKDKCYYKGEYGTIRIEVEHGRVDDVDWKD